MKKKNNMSILKPGAPAIFMNVEGLEILEWSNSTNPNLIKPDEIYLIFKVQDWATPFILRFKSAQAMDALISKMVELRNDVWHEREAQQ